LSMVEHQQYRKIAQHPRRPEETGWQYKQRTTGLFRAWLKAQGRLPIVGRAYLRVWRWAGHLSRLPKQRLVSIWLWTRGVHYRVLASLMLQDGIRESRTVTERGVEPRRHGYMGHLRRGGFYARWDNTVDKWSVEHFGNHWLDAGTNREQWELQAIPWAAHMCGWRL
jgi:hypothetical protein